MGRQGLIAAGMVALSLFSVSALAEEKPVFGLVMSFSGWFQPIDADTIAGVLAAYLILYPNGRVTVLTQAGTAQLPAIFVLGLWIVLQLFSGIGSITTTTQTAETGGVAYMAHIGGFFAGALLVFYFRQRNRA